MAFRAATARRAPSANRIWRYGGRLCNRGIGVTTLPAVASYRPRRASIGLGLKAPSMATLRGTALVTGRRAARWRLKSAARRMTHRPAMAVRRRYYADGTMTSVVGRLPAV